MLDYALRLTDSTQSSITFDRKGNEVVTTISSPIGYERITLFLAIQKLSLISYLIRLLKHKENK